MLQHVNSNSRGFTLLEVMVSILILSVGLLGLLQTVNMAYSYNLATMLRNEAVLVGDDEMTKVKVSLPFDQITSSNSRYFVPRRLRSAATFKNYSIVKRVTTLHDTTTPDGQQLTSRELGIAVIWNYKGQSYTHNISSIISR